MESIQNKVFKEALQNKYSSTNDSSSTERLLLTDSLTGRTSAACNSAAPYRCTVLSYSQIQPLLCYFIERCTYTGIQIMISCG
jgi:hypothetical protein